MKTKTLVKKLEKWNKKGLTYKNMARAIKKIKNELDIDLVHFSDGGDGSTALYINGRLEMSGDPYHDKIDETIEGFLEGLKYSNTKYKLNTLTCENLNYIEGSEDIPKKFKKINWSVEISEDEVSESEEGSEDNA